MSFLLGSNLVPSRPKDQARYSVRELLILGLTLPIRFCPISKFSPEALGLEIVSLERLHEGLKQYEREQLRQWQLAQIEGKKRMIEAAIGRSIHGKDENQDGQGIGDGEGDKTLSYDIISGHGHKVLSRREAFRGQDTIHLQIPPTHSGAPVNINIGLSLDYSSTQRPQVTSTATSQTWSSCPPTAIQPANFTKYLDQAPSTKSGPTASEAAAATATTTTTAQTPPTEFAQPGLPPVHGGDTPNSMAVERYTEPSLRSYSPTSSIRAPSELDYMTDSIVLEPHAVPFVPSTPMSGSIATLIPHDSPGETLVATPRKEREEEFVVIPPALEMKVETSASAVVSGPLSATVSSVAGASSLHTSGVVSGGTSSRASSVSVSAPAGPGLGKALLGKGKIDPKAQDDFIAFMLGKK